MTGLFFLLSITVNQIKCAFLVLAFLDLRFSLRTRRGSKMIHIDNIYCFVETELQKNIDAYQYLSATRLIRLQAILSPHFEK